MSIGIASGLDARTSLYDIVLFILLYSGEFFVGSNFRGKATIREN
jgi:hypothetical protein